MNLTTSEEISSETLIEAVGKDETEMEDPETDEESTPDIRWSRVSSEDHTIRMQVLMRLPNQ